MRRLGFTSSRTGRVLRSICDDHGIDYAHFRQVGPDDASIVRVIPGAVSWAEALEQLGYAPDSGSARATVRKHCRRLGIDTNHLTFVRAAAVDGPVDFAPQRRYLRAAGPYLVAAALSLSGRCVSLAAEGASYDLLMDDPDQGLLRIQVKTTTRVVGSAWNCQLTRSVYRRGVVGGHGPAAYCSEDVDLFACVDGDGCLYLLPIKLVEGRSSISLRKYDAFKLPLKLDGLTVSEFATSSTDTSGHH